VAGSARLHGPNGQGPAAELRRRENVVRPHTCGKAPGCEGVLVVGPAIVRDMLVNREGLHLFDRPLPLIVAAALTRALGERYWKPVQAGFENGTDVTRVVAVSVPCDCVLPEAYRLAAPARRIWRRRSTQSRSTRSA
jgi:hypothetical protein